MISFTAALREIEDKKDKYEIIIDSDYVRIQAKEDFEDEGLETYRFYSTPDEILWYMLVEMGYSVEEG